MGTSQIVWLIQMNNSVGIRSGNTGFSKRDRCALIGHLDRTVSERFEKEMYTSTGARIVAYRSHPRR